MTKDELAFHTSMVRLLGKIAHMHRLEAVTFSNPGALPVLAAGVVEGHAAVEAALEKVRAAFETPIQGMQGAEAALEEH